jgi:hypothetical protein
MPTPRKPTSSDTPRAYKVFVSSTYLDNTERRKIVQDAVTMAGMVWHGMEIFTAGTRPTVEECVRLVKEADLLVGIIAWRYGWQPEGQEKSITELEYDAAEERLMFQKDPSLPINRDEDFDPGPERWKKQEKLEAFITKFSADQMPTYFKETTLQAKVLQTLNQWRERRERHLKKKAPGLKKKPVLRADSKLAAEIRNYCQKAEALHATLPVAGFCQISQFSGDVPGRCGRDLCGTV